MFESLKIALFKKLEENEIEITRNTERKKKIEEKRKISKEKAKEK